MRKTDRKTLLKFVSSANKTMGKYMKFPPYFIDKLLVFYDALMYEVS